MIEIDIGKLIKALFKRLWIIILTTGIFMIGAYIYTSNYVTPIYTASITLYVQNTNDYDGYISSGDLASSENLAGTISVLLTSNNVMSKGAESLGEEYSPQQLASMIDTRGIFETGVLEISVKSSDPYRSQTVANAIGAIAPAEIMSFITAGNVKLIDQATLPAFPSSPNIMSNATRAAGLGFVITCIIIVLIELFNTKIRSENDIKQIADTYILELYNVSQIKLRG
jgi:capsular polysaccharide biosynthesis protein